PSSCETSRIHGTIASDRSSQSGALAHHDRRMLEIRDVTKTYADGERRVEALAKVSVELRPGELVAVEGPSGCGKTTLLLVAGGLLEPDSGEVRLENVDLYSLDAERRADARGRSIGFVFQQFHLVPYLSVEENVLVPSLALSGN